MNDLSQPLDEPVLQFGPYRYYAQRRVVCAAEGPLQLGSRALEILQLLIENAGEVVSKQAIIDRVWPTTVVEESNLRVHIAALRRALGDGLNGQRYISNVPLRGYSFVATVRPLMLAAASATAGPTGSPHDLPMHNLPVHLQPLLGRERVIIELTRQLPECRFISLVGAGGVGKTRVAATTAAQLLADYAHGVCFIDLSALTCPTALAPALAHALGLQPRGDITATLIEHLRERHLLLVLDNCEHLIDTCAVLAERLLCAAPHLGILATSREPLRAEGECVYRLPPLRVPPRAMGADLDTAMEHCAVRMLVNCATAHQADFRLQPQDVAQLCDLCRRLDGLPLAIELAAVQVAALGLAGVLAQLDNGLEILNRGRRTATPRQQSLRAALDWSYALLCPLEREVLQRLAIFRTAVTLRTAIDVLTCERIGEYALLALVTQLVAKSLLIAEPGKHATRYRLPTTTRAYALEKLRNSGELPAWQQRGARYWQLALQCHPEVALVQPHTPLTPADSPTPSARRAPGFTL